MAAMCGNLRIDPFIKEFEYRLPLIGTETGSIFQLDRITYVFNFGDIMPKHVADGLDQPVGWSLKPEIGNPLTECREYHISTAVPGRLV